MKHKILLTIVRREALRVVVESELTAKQLEEKFQESGDGIDEYRFSKDSTFEEEVSFEEANKSQAEKSRKPLRVVTEYINFQE